MSAPNAPALPSAAELSAVEQEAFVHHLGAVYEHSPWIPRRAWQSAPFADRSALAGAMEQVLRAASRDEQLRLILAHPELTGRAGVRKDLTSDSSREQRGAGLDQCTPEEFERLSELNTAYRTRHGFPFIMAVAGCNREQIIASLAARVGNPTEQEFQMALTQIVRIAELRLALLVAA